MPLRSLVVDFNSFFASVEQQENPRLRGLPVAVAPVSAETTCCIAASYEAKRHGVRVGTMVREARKLCPQLTVVEAQPPLYVEYRKQLEEAIDSCLPVSEILSIDEMSCELHGPWQERERAVATAQKIKRTIADQVGICLRSSIGIAPNPFLAKTASDMQKPDGLVVIEDRDLPDILFGLMLDDLCGIADARLVRLQACGITTVEQLCRAPKHVLRTAWRGIEGDRYYANLRGEEIERPPKEKWSVGHAHVLEPEYRTWPLAEAVLHRLLQKAAARLREMNYVAAGLGVSVKVTGSWRWADEIRFLATRETLDLLRAFDLLWQRRPASSARPLQVDVTLLYLTEARNITPLFPQMTTHHLALDAAVDGLNERYGKNSIYYGGAQEALASAPMRIAFTHIPKPEKHRAETHVPAQLVAKRFARSSRVRRAANLER